MAKEFRDSTHRGPKDLWRKTAVLIVKDNKL